jgi:hypothetical protein
MIGSDGRVGGGAETKAICKLYLILKLNLKSLVLNHKYTIIYYLYCGARFSTFRRKPMPSKYR